MTIPISTVVSFCIALLLTTLVPLIILLVLCVKKNISVIPMLMGVGAFFVSQIVIRIPILNLLSSQNWYQNFISENMILYLVLVGGLSAGLFEETARFFGAKLLKQKTTYRDAISFGLGHAFCEIILINGLMNVNNVVYSLLINTGNAGQLYSPQIIESFIASTPTMIAIGIFERLPSIVFHIFATLLIFKGVNERKVSYYFYAIGAHTVLNSTTALLSNYIGIYVAEGTLLLFGVLMIIYIIKIKAHFKMNQNSIIR